MLVRSMTLHLRGWIWALRGRCLRLFTLCFFCVCVFLCLMGGWFWLVIIFVYLILKCVRTVFLIITSLLKVAKKWKHCQENGCAWKCYVYLSRLLCLRVTRMYPVCFIKKMTCIVCFRLTARQKKKVVEKLVQFPLFTRVDYCCVLCNV